MSEFYADLADTAREVLAEFGAPLTLRIPGTAGSYDPVTGNTIGGAEPVDTPTHGVALTITNDLKAQMDIQAGDRVYMLDATVEPQLTHKLMLDGAPWPIINIVPLKPAETALAYTVQARA